MNNYRDPFSNISIEIIKERLSSYQGLDFLLSKRLFRLIKSNNSEISFYLLPRIIQWIIIGGDIAQKKLRTIDNTIITLLNKEQNLNKKIMEFCQFKLDHDSIFNFLMEFMIIAKIINSKNSNFIYEEVIQKKLPRIDLNFSFKHKRIRLELTHKKDIYNIHETVEILKNNLRYSLPMWGGEIRYSAPILIDYETNVMTLAQNLNNDDIKSIVNDAINKCSTNDTGIVEINCRNDFFQIELKKNYGYYTSHTRLKRDKHYNEPWPQPDINGYFQLIKKKLDKIKKINDDSYKIIGIDFEPSSDLNDVNPYQDELRIKIKNYINSENINIQEIVSFNMRFETGNFNNANILWLKNSNGNSLFYEIFNISATTDSQ